MYRGKNLKPQSWILWLARAWWDEFPWVDATWWINWETEKASTGAPSFRWLHSSGCMRVFALVEAVGIGMGMKSKLVASKWAVRSAAWKLSQLITEPSRLKPNSTLAISHWRRAVYSRTVVSWQVRPLRVAVDTTTPCVANPRVNHITGWARISHRCQAAEDQHNT